MEIARSMIEEVLSQWKVYKQWVEDENRRELRTSREKIPVDSMNRPLYAPYMATIEGFLDWLVYQQEQKEKANE